MLSCKGPDSEEGKPLLSGFNCSRQSFPPMLELGNCRSTAWKDPSHHPPHNLCQAEAAAHTPSKHPRSRKPNPTSKREENEILKISHRPGCLHPAPSGSLPGTAVCRGPAVGKGGRTRQARHYLLGARVLYQRWAAAAAPHHLPQNTGRWRHPNSGGAQPASRPPR